MSARKPLVQAVKNTSVKTPAIPLCFIHIIKALIFTTSQVCGIRIFDEKDKTATAEKSDWRTHPQGAFGLQPFRDTRGFGR
jgi:hypothetical protein